MSILCGELEASESESPTVHIVLFSALRETFFRYDEDKNGVLSPDEAHRLVVELSNGTMSDDEIQTALYDLDLDGSGCVEVEEFMPWWRTVGISKVFSLHDADASMSIDANELEGVMRDLGIQMSAAQRAEVMSQLDVDGSGTISFEEYLRWFDLHDIQSEFNKYDDDESGSINKKEFAKLVATLGVNLTRKESTYIFKKLDVDGSGVITFDEFHPVRAHA